EVRERALVIILRSQAHINCLSGDSHVVPLPFEAGSAWPTARGFLLQRRLSNAHTNASPLYNPVQPLATSKPYHASRSSHLLKTGSSQAPWPSLTVTAPPEKLFQMP